MKKLLLFAALSFSYFAQSQDFVGFNQSNYAGLMDDFVIWFALLVMSGISDVVFVADRMPMVCRTDWSRENEWNVGSGFIECCPSW